MPAAVFTAIDHSWMIGATTPDPMSDSDRDTCPPHYYNQAPIMANQWTFNHEPPMGGMQDLDLTMLQDDQHHYANPVVVWNHNLHGFQLGRPWPPATHSDNPSPIHFAHGTYQDTVSSGPTDASLYRHIVTPASALSPTSSNSEASPHQQQKALAVVERPLFSRSTTAPEPRQRNITASPFDASTSKRGGSDDGGDDDYVPHEDTKRGGRKRQRIPHTAVERRYRENLNAHLEKLRQNVPSLASKVGDAAVEASVKPSKCEILNGAIEHISKLDKENLALKAEVKMMMARLEELDRQRGPADVHGVTTIRSRQR